jgi:hypothetical protein
MTPLRYNISKGENRVRIVRTGCALGYWLEAEVFFLVAGLDAGVKRVNEV